jgi:hypothetical protein
VFRLAGFHHRGCLGWGSICDLHQRAVVAHPDMQQVGPIVRDIRRDGAAGQWNLAKVDKRTVKPSATKTAGRFGRRWDPKAKVWGRNVHGWL